jgi:hypothetical protein
MFAWRINSPNSISKPRDFWYSVSGSSVQSSILSTDRCDSTSNRRIDSTWSPNRSMRTGFVASGEKTSRIPPRSEYSPTISTGSRRSYPMLCRWRITSSRGKSSPTFNLRASWR